MNPDEKQQRYKALCEETDQLELDALQSPEGQHKVAERVLLFYQLHPDTDNQIWNDITIDDLLD